MSDAIDRPSLTPHHRFRPMSGRDPDQQHRTSTPLELLFDLTFVVAFSVCSSQFADLLAEKHFAAGLTGFVFATFAICWAWINFSWFSSAYDTDDWIYRAATMVQMVGVLVLALGIPQMFHSIDQGRHVDNQVMVAGYVVMRVVMIFQWLRAARQDPRHRATCLTYVSIIGIAQIGWVAIILVHSTVPVTLGAALVLGTFEMIGPRIAEARSADGTPWHPDHIAERYGLLAIIALGEGVAGTVASVSAIVGDQGWSSDAVLLAAAGIGLTFGMWWVYFSVPAGPILRIQRQRAFTFCYLHIGIFMAIVATGAGLHTAAFAIEHKSHLGTFGTVLAVAVPVALYIGAVYLNYVLLVRVWDRLFVLLLTGTAMVIGAASFLAATGTNAAICLLVVTLAPFVTVVGFELVGHRHIGTVIADLMQDPHSS
ncbi:MAG: rane protein [Nocardia sp.]|uniref:low temperature requirement protein A n=1 Tax=Nocardia sp. TaxID=1821 RepID=UPI002628856F|nr:low temperature requirement protein A [Nocardia sp.]MCU1646184.1 rane protein [Nocardia sp.]